MLRDEDLFSRLADLLAPLRTDALTGQPLRSPEQTAQAVELMHSLPRRIWLHRLRSLPLLGIDLSGLDLSGVWLSRTRLSFCRMVGCALVGADFRESNLQRADLSGVDLTNAWMHRASLSLW